jgi:ankyrin repeat protein
MNLTRLPFDSTLEQYEAQAAELLEAHRGGDSTAISVFHENHPRFLDEKIPWLPRRMSDAEIQSAAIDLYDARLALARAYDFKDWQALEGYVRSVAARDSAAFRFESAVEAVISGDLAKLQALLREDPQLVKARSERVTKFDPPVHKATLLHYLGANGIEGYRQKSPANAVEIAKALLDAGAEVDALAATYGGQHTTMPLLVSSSPPAEAGVQVALVETLVDYGADVNAGGSGKWASSLMTALAFGFRDTAEALARRGARADHIAAAAGLGRTADVAQMLAGADAESRHRAFVLAAQFGHTDIVTLLLDAGEDPDRYNPDGNHSHSTPLHQAALAGHDDVVRLLVERGARLDIKDTIYHGTPLDWAVYGGKEKTAEYLRARQASGPQAQP